MPVDQAEGCADDAIIGRRVSDDLSWADERRQVWLAWRRPDDTIVECDHPGVLQVGWFVVVAPEWDKGDVQPPLQQCDDECGDQCVAVAGQPGDEPRLVGAPAVWHRDARDDQADEQHADDRPWRKPGGREHVVGLKRIHRRNPGDCGADAASQHGEHRAQPGRGTPQATHRDEGQEQRRAAEQ